jgi:hypothetical protein
MTFSLWPRSLSMLTTGTPKVHAEVAQVADLVHHGGHVQQRLADGMQPTFRQTPPSVA